MPKLLIVSDENTIDYKIVKEKINIFYPDKSNLELVSGAPYGVDAIAKPLAKKYNLSIKHFRNKPSKYPFAHDDQLFKEMLSYATFLIVMSEQETEKTVSIIHLAKQQKVGLIFLHNYLDGTSKLATYEADIDDYEGNETILSMKEDTESLDMILQLKPQKTSILKTEADKELFFTTLLNPPKPNAAMIELMVEYKRKVKNGQ
jgi:hypothetical protein